MNTIFSFLKKYALIIVIAFSIGALAGYKVLESLEVQALTNSTPAPEGLIAGKDTFFEILPEGKVLTQKKNNLS